MESWWFILIITLCISVLVKSIFHLFPFKSHEKKEQPKFPLPPGPSTIPILGSLKWMRKSFSEIELILRSLKAKYGPIITLRIGHRPAIFIGSRSLAYRALVQNGAIFSDRPKALATSRIFTSNQHNISSAPYGSTWRLLRRNLTSEILHPSRVKSYSSARRRVLGVLLRRLLTNPSRVKVVDHFRYAMHCLLLFMCFGDELQKSQIEEIEALMHGMLTSFGRFNILNFWGKLGKILYRNRWKQLLQLHRDRERALLPLIKYRIEAKKQRRDAEEDEGVVAYVDTLVDLQLPEEKRKLNDGELVTLCSEFLNAGTDTTSTALQWIMANLVKNPAVQAKLYEEITEVVGPPPPPPPSDSDAMKAKVVEEEDIKKMPFLKAVVLEGLRRHPPGHFVLPHAVSRDTEFDGYAIPKNATVNIMVAEIGWDPEVWENPMEFRPERFFASAMAGDEEVFDITGSKEIKMMPFGAGRRICPGLGLALLHLEFLVANLIWHLKWETVDGDEVDLSEKQEFTMVMKNPLIACISPRVQT